MSSSGRRQRQQSNSCLTITSIQLLAQAQLDMDERLRAEINTADNAELHANAQGVIPAINESMPKNTSLNYDPSSRSSRCVRRNRHAHMLKIRLGALCGKQYHDGDTVMEDKLLLFIVNRVANRPLRRKSRKVDQSVPLDQTKLSWRSVRGYVTTITSLYSTQKGMGLYT